MSDIPEMEVFNNLREDKDLLGEQGLPSLQGENGAEEQRTGEDMEDASNDLGASLSGDAIDYI